jgi:CheY-like chemotaxis protein
MSSGDHDILLVEDNQDDMDLALHALRRENLANRIFVARNGEEALDFLFCRGVFTHRSFDHPPKLVLLDLKLPKVDGMEVLKQVKSDPRTKTIPVVIMTTSNAEQDIFTAYNLHDLPAFGAMVNCQYHGIKVQCGPAGLKGSPDSLYRNNGNGTFSDVSKQAGVDDPQNLLGLTAVWSDFNNDGRLELFVANDGAQNYLYQNDGKGHFTDVSYQAGVALDPNGKSLANMGVALGDYLHTGHPSIAITHFSEQYLELFRNDG